MALFYRELLTGSLYTCDVTQKAIVMIISFERVRIRGSSRPVDARMQN